jgi:hypothetical protein
MKSLSEMLNKQRDEVTEYRSLAARVAKERIASIPAVLGVLLTGSVARGDARRGPYGLQIDLTIVVADRIDINLSDIFGPSIEPYIPYHCVNVEGQGFAIEVMTVNELNSIRTCRESVIFAKQESMVLFDRTGLLTKWKLEAFALTDEQIRARAMQQYFRFDYLTNDYRIEKWKHREAWVQITQNANEAVECYCNFLYCINGWFIPRKDWLVYLTYELNERAPNHTELMNELYKAEVSQEGVEARFLHLENLNSWMRGFCVQRGWLEAPTLR